MDITGEQRISATRDVVWKALNDRDILQACIPGCQELNKSSDTEMTAVAVIKVGPVSARFQGAVTLSDLDPPNGYRITGEGQGGVAGFAKGTALVRLEEDGGETVLHYEVNAKIGGKLSQLGGRLIDATARQMSLAFFKRFAEEIASIVDPSSATAASAGTAAGSTAAASPSPSSRSFRPRTISAPSPTGIVAYLKPSFLILLIAAGAMAWLFWSGAAPLPLETVSSTGAVSNDFAAAVQLLVIAAIGYLFGRHHQQTG